MKRYVAKQIFRHVGSRKDFPLLSGRTVLNLRDVVQNHIQFKESICNAGFLPVPDGYTVVAKNQNFSYCNELKGQEARTTALKAHDDGLRILYRIDFDANWRVKMIRKLRVFLNDREVDPAIFIEDVRLMHHDGKVFAFANGNGAWPLLGRLNEDTIYLHTAVANYSAPQKNWMPFSHDNSLYLEHSIQPHLILRVESDGTNCSDHGYTSTGDPIFPKYLHGGAPPLRLNDEFFLGIGNSQHLYWFQERYYAAVFYLFKATPPFRVVKVSAPLRVQSRHERIQYVCGLAFAGENKQELVLSIGICDCDNRFVVVSLDQVLGYLLDTNGGFDAPQALS